jgi:hypothetical protein
MVPSYAFYSSQLLACGKISEEHILAHTCSKGAAILAQSDATTRIDGLDCTAHFVCGLYSGSLRHCVARRRKCREITRDGDRRRSFPRS